MATAFLKMYPAINLDPSVKTLTLPVVATTGDAIVVHVAVASADVTVASVTDSTSLTSNTQTDTFVQLAQIAAYDEIDYTNEYSKSPVYDDYVDGECWAFKTSSSILSLSVNLTNGARFAVIVEVYTGCSTIAAFGTALMMSKTGAPVITGTAGVASTSIISAGFATIKGLNQAAAASCTLRGQVIGAGPNTVSGIALAVSERFSAGSSTTTVGVVPSNTEVIDEYTTVGGTATQQGAIVATQASVAIPATYAIWAVEVKA
jgi:hypothetical protein